MGVYIKNMEMPGSCFVCPVSHPAYYRTIGCGITGKTISAPECEEKRMESCPLISVPPHGRLIDADALMKEFEKAQRTMGQHGQEYSCSFLSSSQEISTEWYCVEDMVENSPTIIQAEEGET